METIFKLLYFIPMFISIAGVIYLRYQNGEQAVSRADLLMLCIVGFIPLLNLVTATGVVIDINEPYKDWWNS